MTTNGLPEDKPSGPTTDQSAREQLLAYAATLSPIHERAIRARDDLRQLHLTYYTDAYQ